MTEIIKRVPKRYSTACIPDDAFCKACNWPIIHVCISNEMNNIELYRGHDWWGYCSNKGCTNHQGEEWFQSDPSFVYRMK